MEPEHKNGEILIICLDDFLFVGNSEEKFENFKQVMHKEIELRSVDLRLFSSQKCHVSLKEFVYKSQKK